MDDEAEFLRIYNLPGLRQFIIDTARIFTKDEKLQEDLVQEAWCRVWMADEGCCCNFYEREAYRAIDNYYKKEMRQQRLGRHKMANRLYERRRKVKRLIG